MIKILVYIVFILAGPYLFFTQGAGLKSDFSLRLETFIAVEVSATTRRCDSVLWLYHQCAFDYEQDGVSQTLQYSTFAYGPPERVLLLKGAESGGLTSAVKQDYFWVRVIAVLGFMATSALVTFSVISSLIQARRNKMDIEVIRENMVKKYKPRRGSSSTFPEEYKPPNGSAQRGPYGY